MVISAVQAQVNITMNPEITQQSTWQIPVEVQSDVSKNLTFNYAGSLLHIDHPQSNYVWYSYSRGSKSFVNLVSNLTYQRKAFIMSVGRSYLPAGPGKMSGLFISPVAPGLDQVTLSLNNFHGFNYRHSIIRLDNRFKVDDNGVKRVVNRWYYLNKIGYNYQDLFTVNFTDAVIATGYNRGLEWYYANPLVSLFMERKHEITRREGIDTTTSVIGGGDNDNHFVGGDWKLSINKFDFYGEWLIDEWQLTPESRDNMQTVFAVMTGIGFTNTKWELNLEYSLAGPWLYLNRALYGSLEKHDQPLGLRSPQSQALDIRFQYSFSATRSIEVQSHFEQRGSQSFATPWDAWNNKVDVYSFDRTLPLELHITYMDNDNRFFNELGLYSNWLGNDGLYFTYMKNFDFVIE